MARRLYRGVLALAAGLGLAACGSTMEVRSLATGRAGLSAYELTGADAGALRREAQRLCPAGGEILRSASLDQAHDAVDGRLRGWLNATTDWLDPPRRAAQLMVLCRGPADAEALRAAAPASRASAPAAQAEAPPSPMRVAAATPMPVTTTPGATEPGKVPVAAAPPMPPARPVPAVAKPLQAAPAASILPTLPIGPVTAEW